MTTESVDPGINPTRGSGLGGSIDDEACVTDGDGADDDDEMHAAKTDAAVMATIGTAIRARAVKRICNSGEGAGKGNERKDEGRRLGIYFRAASIFCMRSISVV